MPFENTWIQGFWAPGCWIVDCHLPAMSLGSFGGRLGCRGLGTKLVANRNNVSAQWRLLTLLCGIFAGSSFDLYKQRRPPQKKNCLCLLCPFWEPHLLFHLHLPESAFLVLNSLEKCLKEAQSTDGKAQAYLVFRGNGVLTLSSFPTHRLRSSEKVLLRTACKALLQRGL